MRRTSGEGESIQPIPEEESKLFGREAKSGLEETVHARRLIA
jgi:hypothetical protein